MVVDDVQTDMGLRNLLGDGDEEVVEDDGPLKGDVEWREKEYVRELDVYNVRVYGADVDPFWATSWDTEDGYMVFRKESWTGETNDGLRSTAPEKEVEYREVIGLGPGVEINITDAVDPADTYAVITYEKKNVYYGNHWNSKSGSWNVRNASVEIRSRVSDE